MATSASFSTSTTEQEHQCRNDYFSSNFNCRTRLTWPNLLMECQNTSRTGEPDSTRFDGCSDFFYDALPTPRLTRLFSYRRITAPPATAAPQLAWQQ
ncbi:hypothetical protein GUJ93_ZPchr0006g45917 [Zizania palustris]|uniref:Uncharacterized protein n=1 Tax=Zizania palustris TaxID=103762 RepID=A0A8J5TFL7_ZIZPA|nr:hypothetical protein GUJ93_ZPchr0006g45917 [Zizania palustris]